MEFKLEPIVDERGAPWGYEVLLSIPGIPNRILFAAPNPELECFLLEKFVKEKGAKLSGARYTFNLSPAAVLCRPSLVERVLEQHENLLIELTEHALDRALFPRWVSYLEGFVRGFPRRFLLDDFLDGAEALRLAVALGEDLAAIKVRVPVLRRVTFDAGSVPVIAEKVETERDFEDARRAGARLFQGYLFQKKRIQRRSE